MQSGLYLKQTISAFYNANDFIFPKNFLRTHPYLFLFDSFYLVAYATQWLAQFLKVERMMSFASGNLFYLFSFPVYSARAVEYELVPSTLKSSQRTLILFALIELSLVPFWEQRWRETRTNRLVEQVYTLKVFIKILQVFLAKIGKDELFWFFCVI